MYHLDQPGTPAQCIEQLVEIGIDACQFGKIISIQTPLKFIDLFFQRRKLFIGKSLDGQKGGKALQGAPYIKSFFNPGYRKSPHSAVRGLTVSGVEETFDIRSTLESFAAFLAVKRFADEELSPLEEKIDEFQRCLDGNDLSELTRINTDFHELLYALSRSPRLIKMIHDLRDDIFLLRKLMLNSADMARLSNKDHREMIRAMKKRDCGKVEKLVKEHITRGREYVFRQIENGNPSITQYFVEQEGGEESQ